MSSDIGRGRLEPSKESVGGINAVYFINYGDLGAVTYTSDTDIIATVAGSPDAYKFDVRGSSSYTENIQSSRENGTTFFEQVLELTLNKLTKEDTKTIKLLAQGRPNIVIEDYNGNLLMAGLNYGCDVTGGTIVTGGAMGDNSGYTLSFTGMEKVPANFLIVASTTETIAERFTAVGITVTSGS